MPKDTIELRIDFCKSGIQDTISQWAGQTNTNLHKAAIAIFSAATGGDVAVSFDNHEMIVTLPAKYVEEAKKQNPDSDNIIQNCIDSGLRRLMA